MLRKFLPGMALVALCLPLTTGCHTKEPVVWSSAHNKRHALRIIEGFEETWVAVDRIFFDLEDSPGQDAGDHFRREGMAILEGLQGFHRDSDSILFDMTEYPLEAEY